MKAAESERPSRPRPRFVLLGAAGYIAPRHLEAIARVGGELVAACDPHDSVGILDRYFPEARFFREFERLDRHVDKLRREGRAIDYVSICTPNYLHDAHVRFALRSGAHAICEKPLVINPWNVQPLMDLENEEQRRIFPVLQLRHHPELLRLAQQLSAPSPTGTRHQVELDYVSARGAWYRSSWKGNDEQSGGLISNIGIHFLDALLWLFGAAEEVVVHRRDDLAVMGTFRLARADVRWMLSIDSALLPPEARERGATTFRRFVVDNTEFDLSTGFEDLHETIYREALAGRGQRPVDTLPAIELSHRVRDAQVTDRTLAAARGVRAR